MNKLSLAVLAALAVGGIAPAQAADCGFDAKSFFEKLQLNGSSKMTGEQMMEAARKGVRAYDACKSGDSFSLRGVWDQIDADMKKNGK